MRGRRSDRGLAQILDVLAAEILSASDEELLAAIQEDGGSPAIIATDMRAVLTMARDKDRPRTLHPDDDNERGPNAPKRR